jgi:integrase
VAEAGRFDRKRRPPGGLSDGAGASASDAAAVAAARAAAQARPSEDGGPTAAAGSHAPALPGGLGPGVGSAIANVAEFDPKRRSPADPGNDAVAADSALARFASTGAPFPAPVAPATLQAGVSAAAQRGLSGHALIAGGWLAAAEAGERCEPKGRPPGGLSEGGAPANDSSGPAAPSPSPALLPSAGRLRGRLASLAETAKAYARSAQADNTRRAYAADWKMFASWLRRQGLSETPPDPEAVGLYLAAQVERGGAELAVATLERRLSGIAWRYRQMGEPLDIRDRHIATVLAGIRRRHARPPLQKAAIFADELLAMLATLEMDLRGIRDRAILAIGFAGGLRRSEIVGLDCGPDQTEDGSGWIEIFREGALLTIRGKTGWREVEIGRGSRSDTCPVALLETWLRLGRIARGPLFRAVARKAAGVGSERLTDKHVVRLVKKCALAAGLRGDLAEGERRLAFGGHSLRAGLASSAQIEEAHVQKHLGHASAEMTRRYQRKRDRFTINLTKAAGL